MVKLLIALRQEVSSPESRFITQILSKFGEVDVLDSWDIRNVTETYDLAIGVGPVTSCPQAEKKMLFVLGSTLAHKDFGWDTYIVTSRAAYNKLFSYGSRIFLQTIPLLDMEAGSRRLMNSEEYLISLNGAFAHQTDFHMSCWRLSDFDIEVPFCAMEFNSRCRNGAIGNYYNMTDGYDIQVRKHLALGSPVICPKDKDVIGDLAGFVDDNSEKSEKQEPIEDKVSESDYITAIEEIIRSN